MLTGCSGHCPLSHFVLTGAGRQVAPAPPLTVKDQLAASASAIVQRRERDSRGEGRTRQSDQEGEKAATPASQTRH